MNVCTDNPYAPPQWQPKQRRCQIRFSGQLRSAMIGIAAVAVIQTAAGASTAVVVTQEGLGASGYIVGITLLTLIVASLVGSAGAMGMRPRLMAFGWGLLVTAVAWIMLAVGLCVTTWQMGAGFPLTSADFGRLTGLAVLSMITVQLLIHRFYHLPVAANDRTESVSR